MEKRSAVRPPTSEEELSSFQRFFIVDGQPFFPLAGQVHNSSACTAAGLERGWKALAALHANTAEIPVYWEQVEPREGAFDFHSVDQILAGARAHGLKVILLWFGSWKNSLMKYTPGWVKANPQRFWRVQSPAGEALAVLSPLCAATREADQRAFCALLDHLHQADGNQATVIAVQVENEPGILGSDRDYSPEGERALHSPVPADLVDILQLAPRSQLYALRNMFYALSDYAAIGFGVFGVEDLVHPAGQPRPEARPLLGSYQAAAAALPLILRYQGTNRIHAIVQEEDQAEQYFDLGDYVGLAAYNLGASGIFCDFRHLEPPPGARGRGLVFQAGPREFYCIGSGYRLLLRPKGALFAVQQARQIAGALDGRLTNYVCVEEGHLDAGERWVADYIRNGDETGYGLWVAPEVGVARAMLSD